MAVIPPKKAPGDTGRFNDFLDLEPAGIIARRGLLEQRAQQAPGPGPEFPERARGPEPERAWRESQEPEPEPGWLVFPEQELVRGQALQARGRELARVLVPPA